MDLMYVKDLERICRDVAEEKDLEDQLPEKITAIVEVKGLAANRRGMLLKKLFGRFGGKLIRDLGSGHWCEFKDSLKACLAAIHLKKAATSLGADPRVILTKGTLETAFRGLAYAVSGQIVIDEALKSSFKASIEALGEASRKKYSDLMTSESVEIDLKDLGPLRLSELTAKEFGYSAPTAQHVPVIGDVEVSPVQATGFPDGTDPENYLICDTCDRPVKADGSDGMMVIERDGDVIRKFHLFHKGECDTLKTQSWRDLSEFTNPECYIQLVIALFNNWAVKGLSVEDAGGLVRVLMGMYRKVFRATTEREHLNFIGVMHLIQLMGE